MNICCLGAGSWGFCLASHLSSKGHNVLCWTTKKELAKTLNETRRHPYFPNHLTCGNIRFTVDLAEALEGADLIVESVTSAGIRPVFEKVLELCDINCPIVMTSKGVEQGTGLILADVAVSIFGESKRDKMCLLSGPSFAQEVIQGLPTSVVATAFDPKALQVVCDTFITDSFRVYPNLDFYGVSYGGALKNVIAIACGVSEGLSLGASSKAALMTRGLHEVVKLALVLGCKPATLYGLSGMGDFVLTCNSLMSRNFRFGFLLAEGMSPKEAEEKIGMVVEGAYTCCAARQLGLKHEVSMPITESVYKIIYEEMKPKDAVQALMQRTIKEEHL